MMRYRVAELLLVATLLMASTAWCTDRIVPSASRDIALLKEAAADVDELGDKATSRLDKFADKLKDSKKKSSVEEQIEEYKDELLTNDAFRSAYGKLLYKEYRITDEIREKSGSIDAKVVETEVRETISRYLNDKFPIALMHQIQAKAVKVFPCYKVGDYTKITVNGRLVSGRINAISDTHASIGSIRLPLRDLNPKFDLSKMEKLRSKYVREHYHEKRSAYDKMLRATIPDKIYGKHGYVRYRDGWISANELAKRIDTTLESKKGEGVKQIAKKEKMMSRLKSAAVFGGIAIVALLILAVVIRLITGKR